MFNYENCWLNYSECADKEFYSQNIKNIYNDFEGKIADNCEKELEFALAKMCGCDLKKSFDSELKSNGVYIKKCDDGALFDGFELKNEGYIIKTDADNKLITIIAKDVNGALYGTFALLRKIQCGTDFRDISLMINPDMPVRMINHWDNMWGDIERGYSGNSFFFDKNEIIIDDRIKAYVRLMASIGINAITINNVNVHKVESYLITDKFLEQMKQYSDIFNEYGIKLFLSINFAAPMEIDGFEACDPLDEKVIEWWKKTSKHVYDIIPEFGGYLVKADSEGRPGPFTYGRNHADGANMLAKSIAPYGGIVVWRCFVYNCRQDWRDRKTDRARAAYDNFAELDGLFDDNVILQIKNGPMDFQVREPVSPLFGRLKKTNMFLEVQAAQEYTGQQKHVCYLIPMWKEILDFNTYADEKGQVKDIISGKSYGNKIGGMAVVTNTGNDENWTGHDFAAANLFGYGMLCFNASESAEVIGREWAACTFGAKKEVVDGVYAILGESWHTYEKYNAPLGIGWMCNPNNHYGPNVDGYEYDVWGTYHRADCKGIGIDRSVATGTGFAGQYNPPLCDMYEKPETTPENMLLFFHHMNYDYVLSTGKTIIQHIYDTHFEGVTDVEAMIKVWESLENEIDKKRYDRVMERLNIQLKSSIDWRDRINTYFFRMSGVNDEKGRTIY